MAYVRKYKTDEELLAAKRESCKRANERSVAVRKAIAAARGDVVKTRNGCPMNVRKGDKEVFTKVAEAMGMSTTEFLHNIAEGLRSANTELFK